MKGKPTRLSLGIRVFLSNASRRPGRQCFGDKIGCKAARSGEDCREWDTHAPSKARCCYSALSYYYHGEVASRVAGASELSRQAENVDIFYY